MRRTQSFNLVFVLAAVLSGCAGKAIRAHSDVAAPRSGLAINSAKPKDRMLVKNASIDIDVENVKEAAAKTTQLISDQGGYLEGSSEKSGSEGSVLSFRVPAGKLDGSLDALSKFGKETERRISATDVTDSVIDLEAKLKNNLHFRDQLRALLGRTKDVKEVISIEENLNRVQAEVDSLQARLQKLKGEVSMSSLTVKLSRKRTLGVLGWIGYGLYWVVEKLVFFD